MYRLLEVNMVDILKPYPLVIRVFGRDSIKNIIEYCNSEHDYRNRLDGFLDSDVAKEVLAYLAGTVKIKLNIS